jgi:pyridoxamine 5'-phosphate oxidase
MDLAHLRREYTQLGLDRPDLAADPLAQFQKWFEQANQAGLLEPNAMSLSTVGADGQPGTRIVLLKSFDDRGLVFFTNYESRKAREIAAHPDVALLFPWLALERQVIVEGPVERTSAAESATYFGTRPYGSQLGAWVSAQSSVVTTRADLETKLAELRSKYPEGRVPPPPFWGGFRVVPRVWEFWQGRPNRLHDRFRYCRKSSAGPWLIERLAP